MPRNRIAYSVQRIAFSAIIFLTASYAYSEENPPATQQSTQQSTSKPAMPQDPIVVNGDAVDYFHEKKQVIGTGNVSITYRDVILTCDKVTVFLDSREAIAEGNVKVRQSDAYFTGDKMSYSFDTRKGSVINGYLNAMPAYGKAKDLEKIAMKDEFVMNEGYVTTCNLPSPHYRIRAKQVKVYLNDKIVAKHILTYIGNVPVMYFPYYVQSLRQKKTHITVIPGQSKEWGYYLLTTYRYHLSDFSRGDVLFDYRSKRGFGEGINQYFETPQIGNGAFKFYYTHENDNLAFEKSGEVRSRYRFQYRHRWDNVGDPDTYMIAEFNKLSDADIIKDIFYNEYEEIGDRPDSYISILMTKPEYSTEFLLRKRFDNFRTVVERLPEYKINIYDRRIMNTSFYYSGTISAAYLNETFDNTNTIIQTGQPQKDFGSGRVDSYNQLSYAAHLFRSLSVIPYGAVRETYYSKNRWGDSNELRTIFSAGVNNQVKFYRVFDASTNFAGLDINQLRHVITPQANYYFMHQPTIAPSNLHQFDEIDAFTANNGVLLGLENRLQTKRKEGDQMKSVDLATLLITSDYMFRLDKGNTRLKKNKFKSVEFQLELIPYSWAYLVAKMSVNTKKYMMQSGSVDLVLNGGEKWQLIVGQRFEDIESGETSLISYDGTYKINAKWKARAYGRLNFSKMSFEEQEYTIYRDFHCWIAELTYNIKNMSETGLYLTMRLKAFPEYPVGYRRTISRPRFGAAGETY